MRAILAVLVCAFAFGGFTPSVSAAPKPAPTPKRTVVRIILPSTPLHTEFLVEVNKLGQIVRVKSGKSSKNLMYNAQTYGNVLQMWIRHPDGTAEVGLYRVTYDYSPKTHKIARGVSLVKSGGTWGNAEGAVNEMLATDRRSAEKEGVLKGNPSGTPAPVHLPSLDEITGSPHPTASP